MQYCNRCHFLSWNKIFMKTLEHLIWACKHSNSKFESNYLIFGQFLTYLQNWFLLSNWISECLHTQIRCTRIFITFLFRDKNWQRLQYWNFQYCRWLGKITNMSLGDLKNKQKQSRLWKSWSRTWPQRRVDRKDSANNNQSASTVGGVRSTYIKEKEGRNKCMNCGGPKREWGTIRYSKVLSSLW